MATKCPNKNTDSWKYLVQNFGETGAYRVFIASGENLSPLNVIKSMVESEKEQTVVTSVSKELDRLMKSGNDYHSKLIPHLKKFNVEDVEINYVTDMIYEADTGRSSAGTFIHSKNKIYIRHDLKHLDKSRVVLHEIIHSLTSKSILSNSESAKQWNNYYEKVLEQIKIKKPDLLNNYAFTNSREFMAELFSNEVLIEEMKSIPSIYGDIKSTIWDDFIQFINKLIGIPNKSLYNEAMSNALDIFEDNSQRVINNKKDYETTNDEWDIIMGQYDIDISMIPPDNLPLESDDDIDMNAETDNENDNSDLDFVFGTKLGVNEEEYMYSTEEKLIIDAIINRIKTIQNAMSKNPNKLTVYRKKIENLKTEIAELKENKMIEDILVRLIPEKLNLINRQLHNSTNLSAADINEISLELATWERLLDDLSTPPTIDKPTVIYDNKMYQDTINNLIGEVSSLQKKTLILNKEFYKKNASDTMYQDLIEEDLDRIKNVNALSRQTLDLSRVRDKLAKSIDGYLKRSDRSYKLEYSERDKKIVELSKDLTEAELNMLLQKGKNGKWNGNMVTMFTQEYWDDLRKNNRLKYIPDDLKDSNIIRSKLAKWRKWENSNRVIFNPLLLFENGNDSYDEEVSNKEKDKLKNELGEYIYNIMYKEAERKWDKWLDESAAMKADITDDVHTLNKYSSYSADEKLNKIESLYNKWEMTNSPVEYLRVLGGSSLNVSSINGSGDKYLSHAPNRKSGYYDNQFNDVLKNDKLLKFYEYYNETIREMRAALPYYEQNHLQPNFIPHINKEIFEVLKAGDLTKSDIKDKLSDMFSSSEKSTSAYEYLDEKGRPAKQIPINYTDDKVNKLYKNIQSLEHRIDTLKSVISRHETQLKQSGTDPELIIKKLQHFNDDLTKTYGELETLNLEFEKTVNTKSTDIVQALRVFTLMGVNYKHKSHVEDMVLIGKRIMDEAVEVQLNSQGKEMKKLDNRLVTIKDGAVNLKEMTQYAIDAIIYGDKRGSETLIKRKIYKTDEVRKEVKSIREEMKQLEREYYSNKIKEDEFEKQYNILDSKLSSIEGGNHISATKIADMLLQYTQLKGIGYNVTGAFSNVMFGIIANSMHASSNAEFTSSDWRRAVKLMLNTTKKSVGLGTNEEAAKINALINKYGVLFDLDESAYGNNTKLAAKYKKLGLLVPYELQKRGEHFIQGGTLVAMLLHKKVKVTKNGVEQEISLWDAYDSAGNIKKEYQDSLSDNWRTDLMGTEVNEFTRFRDKVIQTNKRLHGNYDPSSPTEIKKHILGRMLTQFRSWIAEGVATRFESEDFDEQLGREIKGRYRTYGELGFATSFLMIGKNLFKRGSKITDFNNLNEIDIINMRTNLTEIRWFLSLATVSLIMTAVLGEIDDEDEEYMVMLKLLINQSVRLKSDVTFYISPSSFESVIKNPIPVMKTYLDVARFFKATKNVLTKSDKRYDTWYYTRSFLKMFPAGTNIVGTIGQATEIYDK